jgi:hypothetical protein
VAYDNVVARVRAGRTIDQVRAELDVVSSQLRRDYPATNDGWAATAETLRDSIVGGFGRASWLFLFAVAGVLLAACANVAGLLTARALNRRRDTGIRIALGASVRQLAQLWICEALVLAVAGGAVGVALAAALVGLLRAASPQGLPRVEDIAVDWPVLAVAAAAILFAALVSGLTPLIVTSSRTSAAALGAGTGRFEGTPARRRFGAVLVAMQCAAALALVMLSVVFGRSFLKLTSTDLGWQPEGVLSLHVYPRAAFLTPAPSLPFQDWAQRVVARLEAIPGIARAAVTSVTPFSSYDHPAEIARGATALADEPRWPIGFACRESGLFRRSRHPPDPWTRISPRGSLERGRARGPLAARPGRGYRHRVGRAHALARPRGARTTDSGARQRHHPVPRSRRRRRRCSIHRRRRGTGTARLLPLAAGAALQSKPRGARG